VPNLRQRCGGVTRALLKVDLPRFADELSRTRVNVAARGYDERRHRLVDPRVYFHMNFRMGHAHCAHSVLFVAETGSRPVEE